MVGGIRSSVGRDKGRREEVCVCVCGGGGGGGGQLSSAYAQMAVVAAPASCGAACDDDAYCYCVPLSCPSDTLQVLWNTGKALLVNRVAFPF